MARFAGLPIGGRHAEAGDADEDIGGLNVGAHFAGGLGGLRANSGSSEGPIRCLK